MFNCRKSVPIRPTDIEDIGPVSLLLGDNPGWLGNSDNLFLIKWEEEKRRIIEQVNKETVFVDGALPKVRLAAL